MIQLLRYIEIRSIKLRINATILQIADLYLTNSEMCDTATNDCFKCCIVTIWKGE